MSPPPLVFRLILAAIVLTPLLSCASAPRHEPTLARGLESRVILLLPFNVTDDMPSELESRSPIVWNELERYLREQGKQLKTVSWQAARALWVRSVRKVRSEQGGDQAGYDDAARALARELRSHAEFDTMVAPSLFLREARITSHSAHWDGVERELEIEALGRAARILAGAPLEGSAPAASIHVAAFDALGDKLHEARGGLELLVRVRAEARQPSGEPTFQFATRTDLFANRTHVREGIDTAFVPFLPPLTE